MGRPSKEDKAKKALLDAFNEEDYLYIEHDGGYILYDKKRKSKRSNHLYLGKFYINTSGTKYSFREVYYDTKESLIQAIEEYNKTLPFNAENFNPLNRRNYIIESCIDDYLTDLGFKRSWKDNSVLYILRDSYDQDICVIDVTIEMDTTKGVISRLIKNSDTWTEAEFKDLDSAIAACNSIICGYCLGVHAKTTNILNKMTSSRCSQILNKTFDINTLNVYTEDAKAKTIEHLEAELNRLKETE